MANESNVRTVSKQAAGDLSTKQFYAVYISGDDTVDVCNGFLNYPTGVLRNKPSAAGRAAEVQRGGEGQVKLGGTVSAGQRIRPDSDGRWIAVWGNQVGWAEAQQAGVANDVIKAEIFCEGGGSAAGGTTLSP